MLVGASAWHGSGWGVVRWFVRARAARTTPCVCRRRKNRFCFKKADRRASWQLEALKGGDVAATGGLCVVYGRVRHARGSCNNTTESTSCEGKKSYVPNPDECWFVGSVAGC